MKKSTFFTLAAAAALLAGSSAAKAVIAEPAAVTPADTFSFELVGSNYAGTTSYVLGTVETAVFGLTTTYTGAGVDGQSYTVSSSEATSGSTTTDTVTVSTPTSFINEATYNGTTISTIQFNIGSSNTLDFSSPLTGVTASGTAIYNTSSTATLTADTTLSNGFKSVAALEGLTSGSATTGISVYTPHSFSYIITYAVPEPSTFAFAGIGALALGTVFLRRNQRQAAL